MLLIIIPLAILIYWKPAALLGAGAADQYGFSGTSRKEAQNCGNFIKEHTKPDDLIISDPFIALAAERIKVVKFKDNWGLMLWMNAMMEKNAYRENVEKFSRLQFGEVRALSHKFWIPLVETALASRTVGAIQPNYELPMTDENLINLGFKLGFESRNYAIWTKETGK